MTDILERLTDRQGLGPFNQPGGQDRGEDRALERFLKFNPTKFTGESDPEAAENWLERMTNIFAALNYTEDRRVIFALSNLREWHVPELVTNERKRIRRFVQGLNVEIQEGLAAAQISTFTEVLEKAQRVESVRLQVRNFHAKKRGTSSNSSGQVDKSAPPFKKGKVTGGMEISSTPKETQSRVDRNGRDQSRGAPPSGQSVAPQVVCGYCGKFNHTENDCFRKQGRCLYCGSTEHQISKCPTVPKEGGNTQRPEKSAAKQSSAGGSRSKAPARIYALGYQQASNSATVVEGVILAFNCLFEILSDPSTIHTFTKS
nr:uncharacterized protein LOC113704514 [Coffea arabica]XP_027102366.1 uncharacterized protein LOC113723509 [Coffea arabica]